MKPEDLSERLGQTVVISKSFIGGGKIGTESKCTSIFGFENENNGSARVKSVHRWKHFLGSDIEE